MIQAIELVKQFIEDPTLPERALFHHHEVDDDEEQEKLFYELFFGSELHMEGALENGDYVILWEPDELERYEEDVRITTEEGLSMFCYKLV